jgi:hypothetical protein
MAAHGRSSNHRKEIESSPLCGCFHCLGTFNPSAIAEWIDWPDGTPVELAFSAGTTALCPSCGIDSVIGSGSGYPIGVEFLSAMRDYWFY